MDLQNPVLLSIGALYYTNYLLGIYCFGEAACIFFGKLRHSYGVYLFSWVRVDLSALRSTAGPLIGDTTGP